MSSGTNSVTALKIVCANYMQVFIGNPLEEESATAQKYIDEVIKRLLCLKKLDGYPVIRELDNDEDEEVSSLLDMNEIEKLAKYVLWKYCFS